MPRWTKQDTDNIAEVRVRCAELLQEQPPFPEVVGDRRILRFIKGHPESIDKAVEMYLRTARLDLDDYNAEAYQGLHITSMAGTWMSVVEGFGGFRVRDGIPHFNTMLPCSWTAYAFKLRFRGRTLEVNVKRDGVTVTRREGEPLQVCINGDTREI